VLNGRLLDLETQAAYTLAIEVTDNGFPQLSSSAEITINLEPQVLPRIVTSEGITRGFKTVIDANAGFVPGNAFESAAGSQLIVTIEVGAQSRDKLLIDKASGLKAKKGGLYNGKTRIAEITGAKTRGPLTITFNDSANIFDIAAT